MRVKCMDIGLVSLALSIFFIVLNIKLYVTIFLVFSAIWFILEIFVPKQYLVSYMYRKDGKCIFEYQYIYMVCKNEKTIKKEIIQPLIVSHNIMMRDIVILGVGEV